MIAKLTGLIDSQGDDWVVIDVGGVGYMVFCSGRTLSSLPPTGTRFGLSIDTHVREDHIHLYGFVDDVERDWFRLLTTVQGVGARVALAILTVLSPDNLADAVISQDRAMLTQAPGVGPKLGQRIVNELKDRAGDLTVVRPAAFAASAEGSAAVAISEATSALINLGYQRAEAYGAVADAARQLGEEPALDDLIRGGLRALKGPRELNA
ncbi:MAG: Holliday junction branch migration protein RuvA [Rhodospirillales bacterium]|nr:Holliday junction branch migration protein RuvA [Rhodospirillales bacterium]